MPRAATALVPHARPHAAVGAARRRLPAARAHRLSQPRELSLLAPAAFRISSSHTSYLCIRHSHLELLLFVHSLLAEPSSDERRALPPPPPPLGLSPPPSCPPVPFFDRPRACHDSRSARPATNRHCALLCCHSSEFSMSLPTGWVRAGGPEKRGVKRGRASIGSRG